VAVKAAEKQQLWESTRADAVEMESAIIRQFCRERGLPSGTIRVISDTVHEDLPLDFNTLMTPKQNLNYLRLAAELVRSPGKLSPLLELQKRTTAAARHLGQCLQALLE
jgi:nucleoside phosphorylase